MKIFTKKMSVLELKCTMRVLAKKTGVRKVTYNNRGVYVDGSYHAETQIIYICSKLTKKNILQTFFHELAHHIACKRKWWVKYHTTEVTDSEIAFKVENSIDRMARKLWYRYVNSTIWGKYNFVYKKSSKKESIRLLNIIYGLE